MKNQVSRLVTIRAAQKGTGRIDETDPTGNQRTTSPATQEVQGRRVTDGVKVRNARANIGKSWIN
jgi:hypothetical protein